MKIVASVVKWMLYGVLGIAVIVVVINLFDEELRTEVGPYLERGFKTAAEENGLFYLTGFSAPLGADPHAVGRKIVAHYEEISRKPGNERRYDDAPLHGGAKLDFNDLAKEISALCDWRQSPCLKRYAEQREAVANLAKRGAVLLERYARLASYPKFEDYVPATFDTPLPQYNVLVRAGQLRNAQCANLVQQGREQECLEMLRQGIRLSRGMLAGARSIICMAVAVAALHRDYRLLSEIFNARPELARGGARAYGEMLAPLAPGEKDFSRMVFEKFPTLPAMLDDLREGRGRALALALDGPGDEKPGLFESLTTRLFLKRNATVNFAYQLHRFQMEALGLPPAKLLAAQGEYRVKLERMTSLWGHVLSAYNPVGKILMSVAIPDFVDYQLLVHDLDGFSRLVALQWQIIEKGVASERVPDFLKSVGEQYADPYTGKPMDWDPQSRSLSFAARDSRSRYATGGRFTVRL